MNAAFVVRYVSPSLLGAKETGQTPISLFLFQISKSTNDLALLQGIQSVSITHLPGYVLADLLPGRPGERQRQIQGPSAFIYLLYIKL